MSTSANLAPQGPPSRAPSYYRAPAPQQQRQRVISIHIPPPALPSVGPVGHSRAPSHRSTHVREEVKTFVASPFVNGGRHVMTSERRVTSDRHITSAERHGGRRAARVGMLNLLSFFVASLLKKKYHPVFVCITALRRNCRAGPCQAEPGR